MTEHVDFKKNVTKLRKYLTKMNIFRQLDISIADIDEKQLKMKSTGFYQKIIHHVFIVYSEDFFSVVLMFQPNIKTLRDKQFMESVVNINRQLLNKDCQITAEEILSNNRIQKTVEFIADLCRHIFEWETCAEKQRNGICQYQTNENDKTSQTGILKRKQYNKFLIKSYKLHEALCKMVLKMNVFHVDVAQKMTKMQSKLAFRQENVQDIIKKL